MTIFQNGANVLVALKREATLGVPPGATSGTQMRVLSSPGLVLNRAQIQSQEKRSDMLMSMGRLGGRSVSGSYSAEATIGGATDILLEAIMRSTWSAAITLTSANFTTITTTTSTIVAASGSWLTLGIRVGDIIVLTASATAGNNNRNLRVIAVTATTITVADTLTANGTGDGTAVIKRLKKVVNGAAPVRYSHTIEQYYTDIDVSEQFLGCRIVGLDLSFKPGAMATVQYTFAGIDRALLATGASPYFTSPVLTTGLDLIADDSVIRQNGQAVTAFTGLDLKFAIANKVEPVIGSFVSPDVFDNDLAISGTITGLRDDFSNLTLWDAETEFEVSVLLQEPTGAPKQALSLFLSRVKVAKASAPILGDGGQIESLDLMVGPFTATSSQDAGYANISSSAP